LCLRLAGAQIFANFGLLPPAHNTRKSILSETSNILSRRAAEVHIGGRAAKQQVNHHRRQEATDTMGRDTKQKVRVYSRLRQLLLGAPSVATPYRVRHKSLQPPPSPPRAQKAPASPPGRPFTRQISRSQRLPHWRQLGAGQRLTPGDPNPPSPCVLRNSLHRQCKLSGSCSDVKYGRWK